MKRFVAFVAAVALLGLVVYFAFGPVFVNIPAGCSPYRGGLVEPTYSLLEFGGRTYVCAQL